MANIVATSALNRVFTPTMMVKRLRASVSMPPMWAWKRSMADSNGAIASNGSTQFLSAPCQWPRCIAPVGRMPDNTRSANMEAMVVSARGR